MLVNKWFDAVNKYVELFVVGFDNVESEHVSVSEVVLRLKQEGSLLFIGFEEPFFPALCATRNNATHK